MTVDLLQLLNTRDNRGFMLAPRNRGGLLNTINIDQCFYFGCSVGWILLLYKQGVLITSGIIVSLKLFCFQSHNIFLETVVFEIVNIVLESFL